MSRPRFGFGRRNSGDTGSAGRDPGGNGPAPGASGGSSASGGYGYGGYGPALVEVAAPLVTIDALGRKCPIPIIMLAEQIRDVPVGGVIAVLADDPAAYSDIPAWCSLKSHDCVYRGDLPSGWSFGIRRRY